MRQKKLYNIVAIIQARMGSSRLPGKALINLNGKTVTEHVIDIANKAQIFDKTFLAIPDSPKDNVIEDSIPLNDTIVFRGEEQNVLKRFTELLQEYPAENICRITGDNPLIDPDIIKKVVNEHLNKEADYTSNKMTNSYPEGTVLEVVKTSALMRSIKSNLSKDEKEHVTLHIRKHPEIFNCIKVVNDDSYTNKPELRLTLDTKEDLELIRNIYTALYKGKPLKLNEVVSYIEDNPTLKKINADIKQKTINGLK